VDEVDGQEVKLGEEASLRILIWEVLAEKSIQKKSWSARNLLRIQI